MFLKIFKFYLRFICRVTKYFTHPFYMKKISNMYLDTILFCIFTLTALWWVLFENNEVYLYPLLVFFYIRIGYLIYIRHRSSFDWWVRPKEHVKPFVYGSLFWLATWGNFYLFWEYYNIPEWMKKEQALIWILFHVSVQEIIFRSYFFIAFEDILNKYLLIFFSSIVFFMIHLFLPGISIFMIFLYIAWLFWGWLFYKYHNLYANIFSHFLINAWVPYILLYSL